MLRIINAGSVTAQTANSSDIARNERWNRNEQEDLKSAIDALYEFRRKLENLHPNCIDLVNTMLQNNFR
jgi:hypothetical protein